MNWVAACSDTKGQFAKVLHENDTIEVDFQRAAIFHIGSAGASQIAIDGKSTGPVGAPGEVKVVEITNDGVHPLPAGTSASAQCNQLRAAAKH